MTQLDIDTQGDRFSIRPGIQMYETSGFLAEKVGNSLITAVGTVKPGLQVEHRVC